MYNDLTGSFVENKNVTEPAEKVNESPAYAYLPIPVCIILFLLHDKPVNLITLYSYVLPCIYPTDW